MDILKCIKFLAHKSDPESGYVTEFYNNFCTFRAKNKQDEVLIRESILPEIYKLIDGGKIQKDILYLTLLSYGNISLVEEIIEYERASNFFDINSPRSLLDYSILQGKHWIVKILQNHHLYEDSFSEEVNNKIRLLNLIESTNTDCVDVDYLGTNLENIAIDNLDEFWIYYVKEIQRSYHLTTFCTDTHELKSEIFHYTINEPIIHILDRFINFKKIDPCEILKVVQNDEMHFNDTSESQTEVYLGFYILSTLIQFFLKNNLAIDKVEDLKNKLWSIKNKKYQITLLEDIFALLFLQNKHLTASSDNPDNFVCNEKEVRLILYLLKASVDEIKLKNLYDKDSEEYERFKKLCKFVADAAWRLELVVNVKTRTKCESNLMRYMLAQPKSLIQMCLKCGDFVGGYQVIEIFDLKDTPLAIPIQYTEKLNLLKASLKKTHKIKQIHKENPNVGLNKANLSVAKIVNDFFEKNPCPSVDPENDLSYNVFMNTFDLILTQCKDVEDCDSLLDNINENNLADTNHTIFYKKLAKLYDVVKTSSNVTFSELLSNSKYNLDADKYKTEEKFYEDLSECYKEFNQLMHLNEPGILNSNHPCHKAFWKLNKLCNEFDDSPIKYLGKLLNYLKAFSKILYIEQNTTSLISQGKHTSYFELLNHNRSELMGKLLFEKNLDPSEFEIYFGKLKLDYLYHVIGNCFPTINLHTHEHVTKDELYPENDLYIPSKAIITYIQKRNWLLAFILNEMYKVEDVQIDISEERVKTFLNCLKLKNVKHLKAIYSNNVITTVLQNDISMQKLRDYVNNQILMHDNYLTASHHSHISCESLETGEEILEGVLKSTNWKALFDIIDSVPENQLKKKRELMDLRDMLLTNLIQDGCELDYYKYVQLIENTDLRINTILNNLLKWPGEFCVLVIKCELSRFDRGEARKLEELAEWLEEIEFCECCKPVLNLPTWSACYSQCNSDKRGVLLSLLTQDNVDLLLKFISLHQPSEDILLEVTENFFVTVFQSCTDFPGIRTLLDSLPYDHTIQICKKLLKQLKNLDQLQFITKYLLTNEQDDSLRYVEVGLKMLTVFSKTEQEELWYLVPEPLNIVELLIMNTKLDKLSAVLDVLKSEILRNEFDEDVLSIEKVDLLLRKYAEKSLDFRVITQPNPRLLRTPECKLMQSLDSLNLGSDAKSFIMPQEVPLKDEWVENNEVLECMCCQQIVFSMFNRRHHCRRCGRVICYNCSLKRMHVETYGDILVRVCSDCYHQTYGDSTSDVMDTISTKSLIYDYWLLTDDVEHNLIVREEFSYEHAPSVSLCLSLLKYHSKCVEYPKFLLEQCNVMIKLLLPSQEPIQEIDYLLVIKMLKSLAMAAKMSSVECMLQYGTSHADRILSQSELLGLLAERGCLNLLPISSSQTQGPFIDASILRRLRDKLLEREQWNLALEVSTKTGLDNTGIFAAWGKSCLKAGSLLLAREKFQRCLDKTSHFDNSSDCTIQSEPDDSFDGRTRYLSKMSTSSNFSDTKPLKNPPLLNEIIQILESKTEVVNMDVIQATQSMRLSTSMSSLNQSFTSAIQQDMAVSILNKLKKIKEITNGNYFFNMEKNHSRSPTNRPKIDQLFYKECIYYLTKYGTHLSLLEFYIKHGELNKALMYIIECRLNTDIFVEIYLKCLKTGIVNILQEQMSKIDSTLDIWKDYLRQICRHLEKQGLLHSLYQLQQYMGDFIRAAMTCIRFYQENVNNFSDFSVKVHFLHKAEEHLRQVLEQEQWVEVASVRSSASKDSFEEKGLTNPSLVMKINTKDIDKHINTLWRQNEVAKFLADCEEMGKKPVELLSGILMTEGTEATGKAIKIPTLFGGTNEKITLAVLAIISGNNVEDGFEIARRIIQEFKLKPVKVYCEAGKQLAKAESYTGIAQLVTCIKPSGSKDEIITDMCDEMLTLAVATFTKANVTGTKVEDLIKLISDRATKISAYIEAKQLKTAYYLAVKYKRMSDIRRILREAELLHQPGIKALCLKVLQAHSHAPSQTKE